MKKLIYFLFSILIFSLTACVPDDKLYDYTDFPEHLITSYEEAETMTSNKYIVYYYSTNCGHCKEVKQDVLGFVDNFDTLPFYIFNIQDAQYMDVSSLEEFRGTPTVFVMSDNKVLEAYVGSVEVLQFINIYNSISFDYNSFESQHLNNYQDVLDIQRDSYILYYYLDECPFCKLAKEDLLVWAYTRSVEDIYFMNGANVIDPDNVPTELTILNSGTPILLIMSNGKFIDEYYSGSEVVLNYILTVGDSETLTLD